MPRAVMQPAEVVQPVGVSRVIDITEEEGKRIWAFLKHLDDWKALAPGVLATQERGHLETTTRYKRQVG